MSSSTSSPTETPQPGLSGITSFRQPVTCAITGVVLGTLDVQLVEGSLPFLQSFNRQEILHPFFAQSDYNLLKKMKESIDWFNSMEWHDNPHQATRLQVLTCALMTRLECLKQESPGVPSYPVCVGSSHRLYVFANWYLTQTSRRTRLPTLSISTKNSNTQWENLRYWLDECVDIRKLYESKVRQIEHDEEVRLRSEAAHQIASSHSKRVDSRKVWSWIEIQLVPSFSAGRLTTFKDLFLSGDLEPENWLADDVDDLIEAVVEHCDIGNAIMFYVQNRLNSIREHINDFYGSFTVVNLRLSSDKPTAQEQAKELELFSGLDKQVELLGTLPPQPQQKDFVSVALFLKAQAQWRLLRARFELMATRDKSQCKCSVGLGSVGVVAVAVKAPGNGEVVALAVDVDTDSQEDEREGE